MVCRAAHRMVHTSAEEAAAGIRAEHDLDVLRVALNMECVPNGGRVSVLRALGARLRQVKSAKARGDARPTMKKAEVAA